ncbi:MAG: hypothetical protein DYG94_03485 [Leptolyngbya sp. PLA3]|nr:MAG: hypothetical protein EDM82_10815 [Cyanobacteria bacterium CYA]MCE7967792.1 hypothetical protein [Leptolyngbya sp. PL-A3]
MAWFRKRLLPGSARLLVVVALLLLVAWTVGQILTDQHHITQYLWWIPTPVVLALAWPLVVLSWILERLSTRLGGYQLRPILSFALLGITLWFLFGVGHLHRSLFPAGKGSLRVAYWNLAVDDQAEGAGDVILDLDPDIAVVANPRWDQTRGPLFEALRTLGPPPPEAETDAQGAPSDPIEPDPDATEADLPDPTEPTAMHFLFSSEIALATRGSITRWGSATFAAGGVDDHEHRGVVLFAEIEGLSAQILTVWVVDLPSAPALWRMETMRLARSAVASWNGPTFAPSPEGRWIAQPEAGVFPNADLIVGDFNTPRGSASLEELVGSRTNVGTVAGRGFGYTWPRRRSILAIDHCFADESLKPVSARTLDPGMGRHRLLLVDLKQR